MDQTGVPGLVWVLTKMRDPADPGGESGTCEAMQWPFRVYLRGEHDRTRR